MIISIREVIDILIMVAFLGYLFKDLIKPQSGSNIISQIDATGNVDTRQVRKEDFWFAVGVVAPCIIVHELAHKFVAMGFGLEATFHAFYANQFTAMLGVIAILSKVFGWGFIFIVPGFVSISGGATALQGALISFAGPLIHALFYAGAHILLTTQTWKPRTTEFIYMTKKINGLLFVFNMLPIPGFDGFSFFNNVFQLFT